MLMNLLSNLIYEIMITLKPITIDQSEYNHVKCPQCEAKIAWKPRGAKVHILKVSRKPKGTLGSVVITCLRCKSNYLINFEDDENI